MLFELTSIVRELFSFQTAECSFKAQTQRIERALVFDTVGDSTIFEQDVLYVAVSSGLQSVLPNNISVHLACIMDAPAPQWLYEHPGHNVLFINSDNTPSMVAESINSYIKLARMERLQKNYEKLVQALSQGKGLQAIVDIGSEILENPISIGDASFKQLAGTSAYKNSLMQLDSDDFYSAALMNSVSAGMANEDSIRFLKSSKRYEQIIHEPAPHVVDRDALIKSGFQSPSSFIDCGVRIKGVFVAMLSVSDMNRPFQSDDLEYCKYLTDLVSLELQKNEFFIQNHGVAYEVLLNDLLNDQISDNHQVRLRLRGMDKMLKENLRVITIRRVLSDTKETSVPLVGQAAIRQFFPGCISVVYKNDIVLLVSEDIGKPISIETNDDFVELLEANQMKAGVSEVFYDTTLMRRYYQQSEKAIELGVRLRPDANIFSYYQFSVYHSMEISAKSISLRDLSHPVVNYLNVSERESDKELLTTLYLWLRYDKDAAKTSNALHIHRSTLFYRLNKIKDLIGSGLDDGELTFQLMYSFKLLEYSSGFTAGN